MGFILGSPLRLGSSRPGIHPCVGQNIYIGGEETRRRNFYSNGSELLNACLGLSLRHNRHRRAASRAQRNRIKSCLRPFKNTPAAPSTFSEGANEKEYIYPCVSANKKSPASSRALYIRTDAHERKCISNLTMLKRRERANGRKWFAM